MNKDNENNDPEMKKKLLEIFREELDEQLQSITNNLLILEKNNLSNVESEKVIETIFRSAHNIKGAARGVGVLDVGNIAHHIETLFSSIKNKTLVCSGPIIDLCLEAIDNMRSAMDSFTHNKPLTFDLNDILSRLSQDQKKAVPEKENQKKHLNNQKVSIDSAQKEYETIRVSIKSLDRISALIEELQVNKISLEDQYATVFKSHVNKSMHKVVNELSILSDALQEEIRTLRLIPASVLLDSLPRITRDISNDLNKKVDLSITGDAVKMDKLILDGLQNPLIHLIRNAIDHGIEKPEIRHNLGKPEIGHIQIHVQDQGNQILISVSDDGMGIDVKKIASIAENKNILSKATLDNMNETAILDLIFAPGFSTKEIITEVSGRGVGLDVVKSNIANLKGDVSIATEVGKGTTFHLRLPLTLASERGLIIKCLDQQFVIPTSVIERVLIVKSNAIIELQASQAILIDEHALPLMALSDVLGIQNKEVNKDANLPILVLKNESNIVALLVHEIIGEHEIVIKPLSAPLSHIPSLAGGTLDANGQVIIVLNGNDLIKRALNLGQPSRIVKQELSEKSKTRTPILVVDDSITTRTLEKNILESKDYEVTVAVNGKEAWDMLQKKKFSLLITDVSMPIMDGFSLTEKVKNSESLRDLPVIIVTSLESDEEKKRGIEVGANAYLVKSQFESQALLAIVEQLV